MERERLELLKEWDKMSGAKHSYLQDVLNGALPVDFRARTANSLYKKGWLEIEHNRYVATYITRKMLNHVESRDVMRRSSKP